MFHVNIVCTVGCFLVKNIQVIKEFHTIQYDMHNLDINVSDELEGRVIELEHKCTQLEHDRSTLTSDLDIVRAEKSQLELEITNLQQALSQVGLS